MLRIVFPPLPPPLRFCRERLLPSLRSSSSLFGRLRKKKFGSRFWNFRFASDRSIYGSLSLRSVNPHFLCSFSFSIYLVFVHSSTFHDKFGTTTATFFGTRKIAAREFLIRLQVYIRPSFSSYRHIFFSPKRNHLFVTNTRQGILARPKGPLASRAQAEIRVVKAEKSITVQQQPYSTGMPFNIIAHHPQALIYEKFSQD